MDHKTVYDSINREKLRDVIDQIKILAKLVRLAKAYRHESKIKVSFERELSEEFLITIDLRQGDTLSLVFSISL